MTEVAFHFNVPNRVAYACRLLRKAMRQRAGVVVTADLPTLATLDQALWSFDPIEFVPHLLLRDGARVPDHLRTTPVWLTERPAAAPSQAVLLNLGDDAPEGFESFGRLIEIVSNDDADRSAARGRWKHYANRGYPIVRHDIRHDVRQDHEVAGVSDWGAPPQGVPTLTEVVSWPEEVAPADAVLPAEPLAELPSEDQLTRQVLADLQRQIDLMLDYRLREVLAPLLARAADGIVRDARTELASTLRDVVARAVAQEISRHRIR